MYIYFPHFLRGAAGFWNNNPKPLLPLLAERGEKKNTCKRNIYL